MSQVNTHETPTPTSLRNDIRMVAYLAKFAKVCVDTVVLNTITESGGTAQYKLSTGEIGWIAGDSNDTPPRKIILQVENRDERGPVLSAFNIHNAGNRSTAVYRLDWGKHTTVWNDDFALFAATQSLATMRDIMIERALVGFQQGIETPAELWNIVRPKADNVE